MSVRPFARASFG